MTENTVLDNNVSSIIKKEGIPKLRFPEFDTLWEQISFSDIFDILQNNTYARADLNYKIKNIKNIHYGDILVKFNEYVDVQNNNVPFINNEKNLSKFKSESYLRDGDIIIADTAEDETVGKVTEISNTNEQKVLSGLHTIPCRPKRKFASMFLGFYMNSESFHKQLIPLITGIKVSSISKTSIATTTISVPLFEEQEKISKFMIAINNMIKEQESSISILETYNKGLISKIFKQEIRFKDDNGNEFPDWIECKLKDLYIFEYGEGNNNPSNGGQYPVYGANGIIGSYTKYNAEQSIIIGHMGAYAGSVLWEDRKHFVTYNGTITKPKDKAAIVPKYGYYLLLNRKIDKICAGSGMPFLAYSTLNNIKVMTTLCLKEQEKIANFLTSLDNVLQEEKNYLEYLKTIKKGLLQQMFV